MKTFSVAEQTVVDPATGASLVFKVDPDDTGIVHLYSYGPPKDGAKEGEHNDYLCATFMRNGMLKTVKMVDAAVEEDARKRKEAAARQFNAPIEATPEDKKKADDAAAKQAADDKALLASAPPVSKYATEDEKAAAEAAKAPPSPPPSKVNTTGATSYG